MAISLQFEGGFSPGVHIQAELLLKGVDSSAPFHTITTQNVSASSERLDPTALFILGKEIMAESLCIQVGCGGGSTSCPLTDEAVYF